ncbi:hypothetical protein [Aeromonas bestiarum]|uniref:hypothetical protein n=1 Tax=Aeromonas bestiarum TaxID=105751 RepID=UPI0011AF0E63|nr:hypothetical protein [Aeromonas bestiarum]
MKEYQHLTPSDEILQGDIFFHDNPEQTLGVIITADCDISQNKTSGVIAYLPIIQARDYITQNLMYESTSELLKKSREQIDKKFNTAGNMTAEAIDHIIQMNTDDLQRKLSISTNDNIHNHLNVIRYEMSDAYKKEPCNLQKISSIINILKPENTETPFSKFRSKIKGIKNRDDCLFVQELSENFIDGYVILLREIRAINRDDIYSSISTSRESSSTQKAIRFSKLAPVYKYWLSHNFGRLFSRVGLPIEYEVKRDSYLDKIN